MPYQAFVRPLNESDRAALANALKWQGPAATLRSAIQWSAISIGTGFILWLALQAFTTERIARHSALVAVSVLIFASFTEYFNRLSWNYRTSRRLSKVVTCGTVSVERVEALGAVELLEQSDEGPTYFFDIGAGQLLHLDGQELYEADPENWPNTVFEIVRTTEPPILLGIFCYGVKITPRVSTNRFDYAVLPVRTGILEGSLDDIEEAVKRGHAAVFPREDA